MIEAGVLIDLNSNPIYWHLPETATAGSLPDSSALWDAIWKNKQTLQGFAHTHPGDGCPWPSMTDITTFVAIEKALGKQLIWWVASMDQMVTVTITDHKRMSFSVMKLDPPYDSPLWVKELRIMSNWPEDGVMLMKCSDCSWMHVLRENEDSTIVYAEHVNVEHKHSHPFWVLRY